MLDLDLFASRYGWTQEQIENTPQRILDILPQIWEERADAQQRAQARELARQKADQTSGVTARRA